MTILTRVLISILCGPFAACSGNSLHIEAGVQIDDSASTHNHMDGYSALTDTTPLPTCTDQVGSCPAESYEKWQVLLDAKAFGNSARFIGLDGHAVMVDTGENGFQVVGIFDEIPAPQNYKYWKVPGEAKPVATAEGRLWLDSEYSRVIVLVCNETRTECSLLRGAQSEESLSPWSGTLLPSDFNPRGIFFDTAMTMTALTVCVYGNGLICFRDGWEEKIAITSSLRLNHVAISPLWSLAVGEQGRWFKRIMDGSGGIGTWSEQTSLGTASLDYASVTGLGGVILGEGRIQAALGTESQFYKCNLPFQLAGLLVYSGGWAYALTQNGEIFRNASTIVSPNSICRHDQLPPGAITHVNWVSCGGSTNPRVVLDGKVLMGQNSCVVL